MQHLGWLRRLTAMACFSLVSGVLKTLMRHSLSCTVVYSVLVHALYAQPTVLTWHNDNARTGQNLQETILTTTNVSSATFGKLFVIAADGKVDAQPLYVPGVTIPAQGKHNVLYVVTEHHTAYAF